MVDINIVFDPSDPTVAWKIDHYNGDYIAIDEYRLDEEQVPIEKRGVHLQGDDIRADKDDIIEYFSDLSTDELIDLFHKYDIDYDIEEDKETELMATSSGREHFQGYLSKYFDDLADQLINDDSSDKPECAKSLENKLDELGNDEFITYFYANEMDLAMGEEWEEVDDDDKELISDALVDDDDKEPITNCITK